MRDRDRIYEVMSELNELWGKYPDMRLGQLLYCITQKDGDRDIFNIEDEELVSMARAWNSQKFQEALDRASATVASWPEWKRNILG